jgi:hypothetical protein
MEQNINPCKCGSTEFITAPNSYDVYELINRKLEFQRTELIEEELKLYCRECGEELK